MNYKLQNVINQNKMLSLHNCVNHHIILYDYLLMSDKNMNEDDGTTSIFNLPGNENENIKMEVKEPTDNSIDKAAIDEIKDAIKNEFKKVEASKKPKISFNDTDSVLDMGTNTSNDVLAPKNIERLEEISRISKEKEREYDAEDDDEFDDGPLNIHDDETIDLGIEDLSLSPKKSVPSAEPEETFDLGIEVLS